MTLLTEINFSTLIQNALRRRGYKYIEDLKGYNFKDLMKITTIGYKSAKIIMQELINRNLVETNIMEDRKMKKITKDQMVNILREKLNNAESQKDRIFRFLIDNKDKVGTEEYTDNLDMFYRLGGNIETYIEVLDLFLNYDIKENNNE